MTLDGPQPAPAADWPNRAASEFVHSGGLRWHIQKMGSGPLILLVHGTGASTHSWAGLAPLLAEFASVLAVDLPGHGYTDLAPGRGMSLPGMAKRLAGLLAELQLEPSLVVGHSAGAAILVRICLDDAIKPEALVSLNGALLPLPGLSGRVFPGAARLLASLPPLPRLLAQHGAQRILVDQLIRQTGSTLDRTALDHYRTLVGSPQHINGTMQMMANWNLEAIERELPALKVPLYLVACRNDKAVAFTEATRIKVQMPAARLQVLPDLGHLGHEENPGVFAELIRAIAVEQGLVPA